VWARVWRNISISYQSLKSKTIDKKPFWRSEMSAVPREGGALRDPYCSLIPESTGHKDKRTINVESPLLSCRLLTTLQGTTGLNEIGPRTKMKGVR